MVRQHRAAHCAEALACPGNADVDIIREMDELPLS